MYIQISKAKINYLIGDVTMNIIEENDTWEMWEEEVNIGMNEIREVMSH